MRTHNKVFRVDDTTDKLVRAYAAEQGITPNEALVRLATRPGGEPLSADLEARIMARAKAKGVTRAAILEAALHTAFGRLEAVDRYEAARKARAK